MWSTHALDCLIRRVYFSAMVGLLMEPRTQCQGGDVVEVDKVETIEGDAVEESSRESEVESREWGLKNCAPACSNTMSQQMTPAFGQFLIGR